jgi:hypothetical protein
MGGKENNKNAVKGTTKLRYLGNYAKKGALPLQINLLGGYNPKCNSDTLQGLNCLSCRMVTHNFSALSCRKSNLNSRHSWGKRPYSP